jgi:protein-disulfide isomerase
MKTLKQTNRWHIMTAHIVRHAPSLGLLLGLALALVCLTQAGAQQRDRSMQSVSEFPIVADEGHRVPNHTVKLLGAIDTLPGVVTVGNPEGKAALVEFYDLNCPYCRIASGDISDLLDVDSDMKLVLVPYPVLGAASLAASRVELAVAKLGTPQRFYDFHRKIYSQHGTTDGPRALAVARDLGFDEMKLSSVAEREETGHTIKDLIHLGETLGLAATPSFIVGNVAVLGYPGRHSLQSIVDASGTCGKVMC